MSAALTSLEIDGKDYDVTVLADLVTVTNARGACYHIYRKEDDLAKCITAGPLYGLRCDCSDFRYRHAGTGSTHGCKHLAALRDAGLLPK